MHLLFVPDPSRYVPINSDLKCGEEWIFCGDDDDDDDGFPITFHVTLPNHIDHNRRLNFGSRDKCAGVLLPKEPTVTTKEVEEGFSNDPYFFERGYYLEAKTGFQIWPGSRLMVEAFTCMKNNDRMNYWQDKLAKKDLTILEVGAGVGFVGSCLAASGGKVLLTDLPVLVEHLIQPNLRRNRNSSAAAAPANVFDFFGSFEPTQIGEGWACAAVLDWFKPVHEQLSSNTSSSIDVIVACGCLFIRKLIDPLLNMVSSLFQLSSAKNPKFLFTYQRRNMMGVFIGMEELLERIEDRGWKVRCLAWRKVVVEGDGVQDLHLFEVSSVKTPDHIN